MNETEIELMGRMLEMDPFKRITAKQAIDHPYFKSLRSKDPEYQNAKRLVSPAEGSIGRNGQDA